MSKKLFSYSHHTSDPVLTPERKIWRAVLEQARQDAELPLFGDGSDPVERTRARYFLRGDSDDHIDLRLVCDYAEIPFDRVVLWARKLYPLAA